MKLSSKTDERTNLLATEVVRENILNNLDDKKSRSPIKSTLRELYNLILSA